MDVCGQEYGPRVAKIREDIDQYLKENTRNMDQYYYETVPFIANWEIYQDERTYIETEFQDLEEGIIGGEYSPTEIEQLLEMRAEFLERARLWFKRRDTNPKNPAAKGNLSRGEAQKLYIMELSCQVQDRKAVQYLESFLAREGQGQRELSGLKKYEADIAKMKAEKKPKSFPSIAWGRNYSAEAMIL